LLLQVFFAINQAEKHCVSITLSGKSTLKVDWLALTAHKINDWLCSSDTLTDRCKDKQIAQSSKAQQAHTGVSIVHGGVAGLVEIILNVAI